MTSGVIDRDRLGIQIDQVRRVDVRQRAQGVYDVRKGRDGRGADVGRDLPGQVVVIVPIRFPGRGCDFTKTRIENR